jgi:hypothetical protein
MYIELDWTLNKLKFEALLNRIPFRAGYFFFVRQHRVSGDAGWIPSNLVAIVTDSRRHVIVFTAPSPVHVGKAVQPHELIATQRTHSSENVFIRQSAAHHNESKLEPDWKFEGHFLRVMHGIDCNAHMPRLLGTAVKVAIVFGNQIDIVKNETVEIVQFESFDKADVEQFGSIELGFAKLKDRENERDN